MLKNIQNLNPLSVVATKNNRRRTRPVFVFPMPQATMCVPRVYDNYRLYTHSRHRRRSSDRVRLPRYNSTYTPYGNSGRVRISVHHRRRRRSNNTINHLHPILLVCICKMNAYTAFKNISCILDVHYIICIIICIV